MSGRITDYRAYLASRPAWKFQTVRHLRLRTTRKPGHLEIARDPRDGEHKLFRHGHGFVEQQDPQP